MDQFLEGIVSVMNDLNIDSEEYLIRIGSRSKSEELQKYAISARVRDARKNRKFDQDYAHSAKNARDALNSLQQRRNLLMDELKELIHLDGIIDFRKLSIADALASKCPVGLDAAIFGRVDKFKLNRPPVMYVPQNIVRWLGMGSSDFNRYQDFTPEQQLRNWSINITYGSLSRNVSNPTHSSLQQNQNGEAFLQNEQDDTEYVEGEYDMDDLMNHRIEIYREIETVKKWKVNQIDYALSMRSIDYYIKTINLQLNTLIKEKESLMKNPSKSREDNQKRLDLQSQIEYQYTCGNEAPFLANKKRFLRFLLKAREEGRLELPQVNEDFLKKQNLVSTPFLSERWAIYFYFLEEAKKILISEIEEVEGLLMAAQKEVQAINEVGEGILLRKAMIVGVTTTGAAKYNTLLRMMKSKIGKI